MVSVREMPSDGSPMFQRAVLYTPWQGSLTNLVGFGLESTPILFGFRSSDRMAFFAGSANWDGTPFKPLSSAQLDEQWTDFAIASTHPYDGSPYAYIWASQLGTGKVA